jgi:hypothetical protein
VEGKNTENRKKIQFEMPQGVVEGLKGIKLEVNFIESIKKVYDENEISR